jgi:hypothetical protein
LHQKPRSLELSFLFLISRFSISPHHSRGRNDEIRRHREIALRMVRYQHCLCLIECGFSPLDFAVFYPADAVDDASLLYLQDKVAT